MPYPNADSPGIRQQKITYVGAMQPTQYDARSPILVLPGCFRASAHWTRQQLVQFTFYLTLRA